MQRQIFCCHSLLLESLQSSPLPWQCMVFHKGCQISCCHLAVATLWREEKSLQPDVWLSILHYTTYSDLRATAIMYFSANHCAVQYNTVVASQHNAQPVMIVVQKFLHQKSALSTCCSLRFKVCSPKSRLRIAKSRDSFWLFSVYRERSSPPFFYSSFDSFSFSALRLLTV